MNKQKKLRRERKIGALVQDLENVSREKSGNSIDEKLRILAEALLFILEDNYGR